MLSLSSRSRSADTVRRLARVTVLASASFLVASCGPADTGPDPAVAELRGEVERLRKDHDRTSDDVKRLRSDISVFSKDLAAASARIAELEARPVAVAAAEPTAPSAGAAKPGDKAAELAEFEALRKKVFDGTATEEEEQRFWELARNAGRIDELMKSLESKVKDSPNDVGARMDLADAYVAKLLSIPGGPEQGIWSNKAEAQWQAVLKLDPDHWEARYSVAFNWSMWPEFLNKTPDAVREFEKLREIQERKTPEAQHAQTYLQLSRMYVRQGKTDKAKETLRAGTGRHPEDAELRKALAAMEE